MSRFDIDFFFVIVGFFWSEEEFNEDLRVLEF